MRFFILHLFLVLSVFTIAQIKATIDIGVGNSYSRQPFLGQLNSLNDPQIFKSIESIHIGMIDAIAYSKSSSSDSANDRGSVFYDLYLPLDLNIGDSIKLKKYGYSLRYLYKAFDLFKMSKKVAFNGLIGWSFGRAKLRGDKRLNQRNPFIKLEVGLQPRVFIGDFAFTFSAFYGLDISSGKWKKSSFLNKEEQIQLPKFKQGGLETKFSVGYRF